LPSEVELHRELGVGLGTLCKAQGVRTRRFVRAHQLDRAPDRFNPIYGAIDVAPRATRLFGSSV